MKKAAHTALVQRHKYIMHPLFMRLHEVIYSLYLNLKRVGC